MYVGFQLPASGFQQFDSRLVARSWELEAGSWKLEAGSWKLEADL
jgi:hypothetical protein